MTKTKKKDTTKNTDKSTDAKKAAGKQNPAKKKGGAKKSGGVKKTGGRKKAAEEKAVQARRPRYRNTNHLLSLTMSQEVAHGRMVSNLAYEVGRELGYPEEQLRELTTAGFFHDIGKSELRKKNGGEADLVVEEMNAVRLHPSVGCEILRRHGFSEYICDAVLHHHENYDGSGYPDNIAGEDIAEAACILRVCDVFCALTSERAYRGAYSNDEAIRMMIGEVEKYEIRVFLALQRVLHRSPDGQVKVPPVSPEVEGVWKTL